MGKIREMDKILIEAGYVARALVKWWGIGQTARSFLWKGKLSDVEYKESWDDPRKPQNAQHPQGIEQNENVPQRRIESHFQSVVHVQTLSAVLRVPHTETFLHLCHSSRS